MDNRTMLEKMRATRVPEQYYDGMYKDGYKPWEILEAARNSIIHEHETRLAEKEEDEPTNVKVNWEVKRR